MKTGKSTGTDELRRLGLKREYRAYLTARWRTLSKWISGELARMRNERLDRGFLATSHGKNYRKPVSLQPTTTDDRIEGGHDQ